MLQEQKNAKLTCYLENKFKDETKPPMRECDKSRTWTEERYHRAGNNLTLSFFFICTSKLCHMSMLCHTFLSLQPFRCIINSVNFAQVQTDTHVLLRQWPHRWPGPNWRRINDSSAWFAIARVHHCRDSGARLTWSRLSCAMGSWRRRTNCSSNKSDSCVRN